jgi:pyruvate/2-oxoglutarate dehydrogenase complex dihydrolipoamide acyltransferase (E2) component
VSLCIFHASVAEATITNWLKEVGDKIEADEAVLTTDKVDSEVPSEVSGIFELNNCSVKTT